MRVRVRVSRGGSTTHAAHLATDAAAAATCTATRTATCTATCTATRTATRTASFTRGIAARAAAAAVEHRMHQLLPLGELAVELRALSILRGERACRVAWLGLGSG